MDRLSATWFFVVDEQGGRLLRGRPRHARRTTVGMHLEQIDSIENPWAELALGEGPPTRAGGPGDPDESARLWRLRRSELLGRYAADLVQWLDRRVSQHRIEALEVFAPPRLLGILRTRYTSALSGRVRDHRGDFGTLTPGELERHPTIAKTVRAAG